jgi:hypothetical protein
LTIFLMFLIKLLLWLGGWIHKGLKKDIKSRR